MLSIEISHLICYPSRKSDIVSNSGYKIVNGWRCGCGVQLNERCAGDGVNTVNEDGILRGRKTILWAWAYATRYVLSERI